MQPVDQVPETQTTEREVSTDGPTQSELHERYIEQQLRLSCPGCGETPHID